MSNDEILRCCSDAVLVLSDGSTVPCSRYVIMAECHVLRAMIELKTTVGTDGKHRIPIVDSGTTKYANFCALVHAIKTPETLTFDELVDVFDAARRLGCDNVERTVLRRAWLKAPNVSSALVIVPELFRTFGKTYAADIVAAVSKEYPLWVDLEREVLSSMTFLANESRAVDALLLFQLHYPPSAVALWMFVHGQTMKEDTALKIVASNSHLYCPDEIRPVYKAALDKYSFRPDWESSHARLLRSFVQATELSTQIPQSQSCGFQVEFEDLPRTFVSATLCGKGKKPAQLGPYVRIRMPTKTRAFGFDVRMTTSSFQVRLTLSRRVSFENPFFEAWYEFSGNEGEWIEAGSPSVSFGDAQDVSGAHARFDIRHGEKNALIHPFG